MIIKFYKCKWTLPTLLFQPVPVPLTLMPYHLVNQTFKLCNDMWSAPALGSEKEIIRIELIHALEVGLHNQCTALIIDQTKPATTLARSLSLSSTKPNQTTTNNGNCIYWRPQHWWLVVNSEVVNPECINYIYWRPYLVWFIFVRLRSGG